MERDLGVYIGVRTALTEVLVENDDRRMRDHTARVLRDKFHWTDEKVETFHALFWVWSHNEL